MSNQRREGVLGKIDAYYTHRLAQHGATPRGVDWNSEEAQQIRFEQLLKILPEGGTPSILDYGCGYGAFADYVSPRFPGTEITGYDVSASMVAEARRLHDGAANCTFTDDLETVQMHDFVVASGIFSVKMDVSTVEWEAYLYSTLSEIAKRSRLGFAFNTLTAYSDPEKMRDDLYYADPHQIFDYCRTAFSRNIAILHDYGLYEFTTHVRL